MRIFAYIDNLGWGGAQRQMALLVAHMANRGHDVTLVVPDLSFDHQRHIIDDTAVRLLQVDKRGGVDPKHLFALSRHIRRLRSDVVVAFMRRPGLNAIAAARLAGGVPTVTSERTFTADGPLPLRARAEAEALRLAAHVTANSHHQRKRLEGQIPGLRGRMSTIWNGIDTERFRPAEAAQRRGGFRLLAVGTVRAGKGAQLLAEALTRADRDLAIEVHWAGQVLDNRDSRGEVAAVDARLAQAELTERWRWLGLCADVPELLRGYDALVHPSFGEGLPNAVCEALASGIPAIASDIGDHRRLISPPERGWLYTNCDADSLATTLATAAGTPWQQRRAMGAAARQFALDNLSLDAYADNWEALLERVAKGR